MEDFEKIELRSEEVQEILGTPPSWTVLWGSTVIFLTIAALLAVSWMVKYPDIINAEILLTTSVPPVDVVARTDGRLAELRVADNAPVKRGDLLVVLQSTGHLPDVLRLDSLADRLLDFDMNNVASWRPSRNLDLGELQADYSTFVQLYEDFAFSSSEKNRFDLQKINGLQNQIASMNRGIKVEIDLQEKARQKLEMEKTVFEQQQNLYAENVISRRELEAARSKVLDAEREFESFNSGKISKEIEIANISKQIGDVSIGSKEGAVSKFVALRESISRLRSSLDSWKLRYLLTAPIDGKISLNADYFSVNQNVKSGDVVLSILPQGKEKMVGRVNLPLSGSGKVAVGQRVLISFENYPSSEYGVVEGLIESKSSLPKDGSYPVLVRLPDSLVTSYRRVLTFEQKMQGRAQIITEERRFIERIFDGLKSLWKNH